MIKAQGFGILARKVTEVRSHSAGNNYVVFYYYYSKNNEIRTHLEFRKRKTYCYVNR